MATFEHAQPIDSNTKEVYGYRLPSKQGMR